MMHLRLRNERLPRLCISSKIDIMTYIYLAKASSPAMSSCLNSYVSSQLDVVEHACSVPTSFQSRTSMILQECSGWRTGLT